jgi:hypothetical protein
MVLALSHQVRKDKETSNLRMMIAKHSNTSKMI